MKKYFKTLKLFAKDQINYRSQIISNIIMSISRTVVLFLIYKYSFEYIGGKIGNVNLQNAIWALAMYFAFMQIGARTIVREVTREVKSGAIETKIGKPYRFSIYTIFAILGKSIPNFIFSGLTIFSTAFLIAGFPFEKVNLIWTVQSLLLFFVTFCLYYVLMSVFGLIAFWVEDSEPMFWVVDKAIMILGGAFFPVALFPESVKLLSEITPFGASFAITRIFNADFSANFSYYISVGLIWTFLLTAILVYIEKKALKKININGG